MTAGALAQIEAEVPICTYAIVLIFFFPCTRSGGKWFHLQVPLITQWELFLLCAPWSMYHFNILCDKWEVCRKHVCTQIQDGCLEEKHLFDFFFF